MRGPKGGLGWIQTLFLDLCEPAIEGGFIDPFEFACFVVASLGLGFPYKGAYANGSDVDFRRTVHVGNPRARKEAFHAVRPVKCAWHIRNATTPVHRVRVHAARIPITGEAYMATHVRKFGAEHFIVEATRPREEWKEPGWEHRHGFNLDTVAVAVKVLEIVHDGRENWTFPGIRDFGIRRGD